MKIFKILALAFLAMPATIAMDDFGDNLPQSGKTSSRNNQTRKAATSKQTRHPETLADLKSLLKNVTTSLKKENETLRKQLGLQSAPSFSTQNLPLALSPQEASLQEGPLETEIEFVERIFVDFRKWLSWTTIDLKEENAVLKHLLTQKEQSIDIEFSDGKKATYSDGSLSFKGPVSISTNFQMTKSEAIYGGIHINRALPLSETAQQLQGNPAVKQVVLRDTFFSLDHVFQSEIVTFNNTQSTKRPLQEEIDIVRKFYARSLQYQKLGLKDAKKNIPMLQSIFGIKLANLPNNQEGQERISSLREAALLLEKSASLWEPNINNSEGVLLAKKSLPEVIFLLSVSLINSTNTETNVEKTIPTLRKGLLLMRKAIAEGHKEIDIQLAKAQFRLAEGLYLTVFPNNSQKKFFDPSDVKTLKEAQELLISAETYVPDAQKLYNYIQASISAFTSSAQGLPDNNSPLRNAGDTPSEEEYPLDLQNQRQILELTLTQPHLSKAERIEVLLVLSTMDFQGLGTNDHDVARYRRARKGFEEILESSALSLGYAAHANHILAIMDYAGFGTEESQEVRYPRAKIRCLAVIENHDASEAQLEDVRLILTKIG